ncbi:hypothetical protein PENTCL1PPCAC_30632, partial [Pristionchus entomophagus]
NNDIVSNVKPALPFADHTSISFSFCIPSPPNQEFIPSRMYHLADWDNPSEFSRYPRKVRILYGKFKSLSRIAPNSVACHTMSKRFKSALNSFHCYLEDRIVTTSNSSAFYKFCSGKLKAPKSTPSAIIDSNGTTLLTNDEKCVSFSDIKSSKSAPPGIIDMDGTHLLSNIDKAQAFSKYFSSVSTLPLQAPLCSPTPSPLIQLFDLPSINTAQILVAIRSLAPKCNSSPDGLPNIFFLRVNSL